MFWRGARIGFAICLLGMVMNIIVMHANDGKMPFRVVSTFDARGDRRHKAQGPNEHLLALSDNIAIGRTAGMSWMVSWGDVIAITGVGVMVVGLAHKGRSKASADRQTKGDT